MESETQMKLPKIDFSKLEMRWKAVKSEVYNALMEYGCFEAVFDEVPLDLRKATIDAAQELFDLPLPIKQKLRSDIVCVSDHQKHYIGYDEYRPSMPLFEGVGIDDANVAEKVESVTNVLWPQSNPSFSKTITSFSEKLSELDHIIRKMILEALGVERHTEEHMNLTSFLLRIQKYRSPQANETHVGVPSHTDKNMVSILYQNHVDGLEVQTKDGNWIKYNHSPDSFIVMTGDSFYAWSNGRLHCPHHRVTMMTGNNEARYTIKLASDPKAGYMIKAPQELVDEEHPLLFKPFDFGDFMKFYFSHKNFNPQSALESYCGVSDPRNN